MFFNKTIVDAYKDDPGNPKYAFKVSSSFSSLNFFYENVSSVALDYEVVFTTFEQWAELIYIEVWISCYAHSFVILKLGFMPKSTLTFFVWCHVANVRIALLVFTFSPHCCFFVVQHLLFSVTEPQFRVKPAGVSDVSLYFIPYALVGRLFSFFFFPALANYGNSLCC